MVCFTPGYETVGLHLEDRREREYSLPGSLPGGNGCRMWQWRQRDGVVRKVVEDLCDLWEMGVERNGRLQLVVCYRVGLRLVHWIWRSGETEYHLPASLTGVKNLIFKVEVSEEGKVKNNIM